MDTLFNLNSDELFEKYSVAEIKLMYSDIEKELNKKKNELRVLVGEKYRDFVEISEKITKMNQIAGSITEEISSVSQDLTFLDVHNIKFDSLTGNEFSHACNKHNTIAILNKLLVDIENQIWTELEKHKFMVATSLLQLAVHIKTVLSLDTSLQIENNFSFVSVTWNSILRFPVVITKMVEDKLKSSNLSTMTACQCLCSITILENLDSIDVIRKFLKLRMKTLERTLHNENSTQKVRARILNSFQIIISTLEILYHCFYKELSYGTMGEYWTCMVHMCSSTAEPAFNLVNIDNTAKLGIIYVPPAIQNFRIKTAKPLTLLDLNVIKQDIINWLDDIKTSSAVRITHLLDLIGKLQTLNLLKQSIQPFRQEFSSVMDYFDLKHEVNIWNELYEPLITDRTKALLRQQWNESTARVRHQIESCIKELSENEKRKSEECLHSFLWNSFDEDLSEKSSDSKTLFPKGLAVKSFGLSPNSGKLCSFVEALASSLLTELLNISSSKDIDPDESTVLKEYQQTCCERFTDSLIKIIQEIITKESVQESTFLLLARFLSGITLFCESLKQCILLADEKSEKWQAMHAKIQEQSLSVWRKWSSCNIQSIFDKFLNFEHDIKSVAYRMQYFPKWEVVNLNEKNEESPEVNSSLYVPLQISFPIQNILNLLSSLVARSLPPRIIISEMTNELLSKIFDFFENLIEKSFHQALYIQFLFDVKYLKMFLMLIDNEILIDQSNTIIAAFETKIDPVDFDAISSQLSENVTRFIYKTHVISGLLVSNKPRLNTGNYSDNTDDPLVVYTGASNVPWFSLIPVSTSPKI